MPAHIHIEGMVPYNGDYPIDASRFNNRELHIIKRISGVRANELEEAFDAGDNDLVVAFALIAMRRAGVKVEEEAIWEADVGAITLVATPDEEDAESPPASAPPSEHGGSGSGAEKQTSSGSPLSNGSDPLENHPSPTGSPHSDTGATSASPTSVT